MTNAKIDEIMTQAEQLRTVSDFPPMLRAYGHKIDRTTGEIISGRVLLFTTPPGFLKRATETAAGRGFSVSDVFAVGCFRTRHALIDHIKLY